MAAHLSRLWEFCGLLPITTYPLWIRVFGYHSTFVAHQPCLWCLNATTWPLRVQISIFHYIPPLGRPVPYLHPISLAYRGEPPLSFFQYIPSYSTMYIHSVSVNGKVAQSCPALCDLMDYMVHGILQARILEWVAFPFSRGSSQPKDRTQVSCIAGRLFTIWAPREAQEYWSG